MNRMAKFICLTLACLVISASTEKGSGATKKSPPSHSSPKIGKEYHPPGTKGGPMVYVPAGEFLMGCISGDNKCGKWGEKHQHTEFLNAFYIDKYEVTQGEYDECFNSGSCDEGNGKVSGFEGDRQPVVEVDWHHAMLYCKWAGKKLPTEAEWEKAARGTDARAYPWGNEKADCTRAVMDDGGAGCGKKATWEVGSKPSGASPYGAMDMAGNVWEWVLDGHFESSPGIFSGFIRGGAWNTSSEFLRASNRESAALVDRDTSIGFRCARTP